MRFSMAAQTMRAGAANYDPGNMYDYYQELKRLGDAFRDVAAAIRISSDKAREELPVHPKIVEAIGDLHAYQNKVGELADAIAPLFAIVHANDLSRHTNPRRGEDKWNV